MDIYVNNSSIFYELKNSLMILRAITAYNYSFIFTMIINYEPSGNHYSALPFTEYITSFDLSSNWNLPLNVIQHILQYLKEQYELLEIQLRIHSLR